MLEDRRAGKEERDLRLGEGHVDELPAGQAVSSWTQGQLPPQLGNVTLPQKRRFWVEGEKWGTFLGGIITST